MDSEQRGAHYGVKHHQVVSSGEIATVISQELNLPLALVHELIELGAVYLKGERVVDSQCSVGPGDYVRVHTTPRRFDLSFIQERDLIVFQNDDFIVVNKPSGVPVHATVDNKRENLVSYLQKKLATSIFVTHRLDNPTSGLLVLALNPQFQKVFNAKLRSGRVQKKYWARVSGEDLAEISTPKTLIHYMEPSPRAPKVVSREKRVGWYECRLRIENAQKMMSGFTDLEITLETGRTHQIRAQLSFEGYPILGDVMYGGAPDQPETIALKSYAISFDDYSFQLALTWQTRP